MGIFEEYLFSQIQIYAYNLKNVRPREITSFNSILEEPAHFPLETSRIVAVQQWRPQFISCESTSYGYI